MKFPIIGSLSKLIGVRNKMPYSEPTNLSIIACPGGEVFANEVISHLRHMYKHRFNLKRDVISQRYETNKDEYTRTVNYYNDLQT